MQSWLDSQGLALSRSVEVDLSSACASDGKPITYGYPELSWPDLNIANCRERLPDETSLFLNRLKSESHVQPTDYVSSLDWDDGSVGESVRAVLKGLMETEVSVPRSCRSRKRDFVRNPLITMEMRHKQVSLDIFV